MKKIIAQHFMAFALALISCLTVQAYDFEVDGIYYNILSASERTCEVTRGVNEYVGSVTIPEEISYKDYTFTVTTIGESAFDGNSKLLEVAIPNTVNTIKKCAFISCSALKSLKIPNSVTTLEYGAFFFCKALQSIEISNSVTIIGIYAFRGCSSLTNIVIPNSVKSIYFSAFEDCTALESVILGNSIESIGGTTFENCPSLKSVTSLNASAPEIFEKTFTESTYLFATLYVPKGAKSSYQSANYWSKFVNIEEIDIDAAGIQVAKGGKPNHSATYDLQGHKHATLRHGMNIIRQEGGEMKKVYVK